MFRVSCLDKKNPTRMFEQDFICFIFVTFISRLHKFILLSLAKVKVKIKVCKKSVHISLFEFDSAKVIIFSKTTKFSSKKFPKSMFCKENEEN